MEILLSTDGIGSAYGYLIVPNQPQATPEHHPFTLRPYLPGIYFWEAQT